VLQENQVPGFRYFCDNEFHLWRHLDTAADGRLEAEIGASMVCEAVLLMGTLGLGSLLGCDQWQRTPVGRRWFRLSPAAPRVGAIVSDTTMARSLEQMAAEPLRQMSAQTYHLGRRAGLSKCPLRAGRLRLGLVVGSCFGGYLASVLELIGIESFLVDLEWMPKRGKELPSSYTLLRRAKERFGTHFVDLMLGDGLYLNAPFLNLVLQELRSDVLVKTDDSTRDILKDAMGLFAHETDYASDIEHIQGFDETRLRSYEVLMTHGFHLDKVDVPLQVAWVREQDVYVYPDKKRHKGKPHDGSHEFWVIASAEYLERALSAEEMRELAHWRWDQENEGFKAANQRVKTKRLYSHDTQAKQAILLLLFVVFNLLGIYLNCYGRRIAAHPGMKQTRRFQEQMLWLLLVLDAFLDDG